jgi:hypothetical protein
LVPAISIPVGLTVAKQVYGFSNHTNPLDIQVLLVAKTIALIDCVIFLYLLDQSK